MDWGSGSCDEQIGRHRPFTRCHPWLIGSGDFVACNASANMQDSLHRQGADGDCPSQAQVGLCFSSSELSILQPSHQPKSCFWYHHRHITLQTAPNHWWRLVSLGTAYHMLLACHVLLLTSTTVLQSASCLFRRSQSCDHTQLEREVVSWMQTGSNNFHRNNLQCGGQHCKESHHQWGCARIRMLTCRGRYCRVHVVCSGPTAMQTLWCLTQRTLIIVCNQHMSLRGHQGSWAWNANIS